MVIKIEKMDGVQLMKPTGRLLIHDGVAAFSEAMNDLIKRQPRSVLLQLDGIMHMDSSGIAALVTAFKKVAVYGGHLKLVSPTDRVRRVLETTKIDHVIPCFATLVQALESFDAAPGELVVH